MHCAPSSMHYALCTMHYALCTMHYAICSKLYALCTMPASESPTLLIVLSFIRCLGLLHQVRGLRNVLSGSSAPEKRDDKTGTVQLYSECTLTSEAC